VSKFAELAMRPVDVASLAAFRIIFGAVTCFGMLRLIASGWIEPMYVEPRWAFKYPGFAWVEAWPAWGMYLHYVVLAILALLIALGVFHRLVTGLFVVGFLYTQLCDVTNYLNHNYLVVLLGAQLALLPANAMWSIDARRDPSIRRATIPAWMIWLVRFQVGVVYVFAGLAKLKADWLLHGQPLNLWLASKTDTPVIGGLFDEPAIAMVMSWLGFLFDTTIVIWLSWARTRLLAYGVLVVFHALTGYLLNIGMFPLIMTSSALIFFSPGWPRHLLARFGRRIEPPDLAPPCARPPRFVIYAIAVHVVIQIALPLRHHIYPGSVLWNEDGMRFAWHVVVREKQGSVMFVARFPNGKRVEIPPNNYLTSRQEREMSGQPDLILQLAREIGRDLEKRGYHDFTIHAVTRVSLNGRRPSPMIDPDVDLLHVSDVGPRTWVLDAPEAPPPHVLPLRKR
jgi:vitamin K-dependent gamma-carboxylase